MKQYLQGWNFLRVLRLALGVMIIVQGIEVNDWMYIIAGSLFSLMPILNVGCCAGGNCYVPKYKRSKQASIEETTYEEVG